VARPLITGFDATPEAVAAVADGRLAATVAQAPRAMGAAAIAQLVRLARGEIVPPETDTGALLVTRDTVGQLR
jgi:ABC-type sugar transport system substrate-binding protein